MATKNCVMTLFVLFYIFYICLHLLFKFSLLFIIDDPNKLGLLHVFSFCGSCIFKVAELTIIISILNEEIKNQVRIYIFQYNCIQLSDNDTHELQHEHTETNANLLSDNDTHELQHEINSETCISVAGKLNFLSTITVFVEYTDFFYELQELTIVSICSNIILWICGQIIIYIIGNYNYSTEPVYPHYVSIF